MAKSVDEKRLAKAQKYFTNAKEEFEKVIPRNKIGSIGVTKCTEKDGSFEFTGSVATTSPTGKFKTFSYVANVKEDADGKFSVESLEVKELA